MLFEDFINRHKDNRTADIVFPHIIFPILMIIGSFFILLFPILFFTRHTFINSPSLEFSCGMTGIGLLVGSAGVGATWGLIKEKKSGYHRANYEFLILRNIFFMAVAWPWPFFYGTLFFYHYPLQTYQTYIFEMKPTPEVKKEIERLNFLEIKSHTPYDYSLAHQKIRYDFMDKIEYASFMSKKAVFLFAIESEKEPDTKPDNMQNFLGKIVLDTDYYPIPIKLNESDESNYHQTCALKVLYKEAPPSEAVAINKEVILQPIKFEKNTVFYDFSSIFYRSGPRNERGVCILTISSKERKAHAALLDFWILNLYLPNIHRNITTVKIEHRHQFDFRWKIFLDALEVF